MSQTHTAVEDCRKEAPEDVLANALYLRDHGNLTACIEALSTAVLDFPFYVDSYGHRAFPKEIFRTLVGVERYDDALVLAKELSMAPDEYFVLLARAYEAHGHAEEALLWWSNVRRVIPQHPECERYFAEKYPVVVSSTSPEPLSRERLIGHFFSLSVGPKWTLLTSRMTLMADGSIAGYSHRNEAAWRIDSGNLTFFNSDGQPSCVFSSRTEVDDRLNFSGRFLLKDNGAIHYLEEVPGPRIRLKHLPGKLTFQGEFGEEINSFIPYIYWLYHTGELAGRNIETYAGMEPFYFFLSAHQITATNVPRCYMPPNKAPAYLLHKSGLLAHQVGTELVPDYRRRYATEFGFSKPILVVHNKYTEEWDGPPVNYFDVETLHAIFTTLGDLYQIVFFEAARAGTAIKGYSTDHQRLITYNDAEAARAHSNVVTFGELLENSRDSYNLLKLKIFSSAYHFLTVQGGNAHLCALFPGSLVAIQHLRGSEDHHAYSRGTFQFLANPRPVYLIGRDRPSVLDMLGAFEDCSHCADRVHLGPRGLALYQKYGLR